MLIKIVSLTILLFLPFFSLSAFSGSVDYRGGHNCWSNCEQYGLEQGEYHIHRHSEKYHEGWG